MEFPNDTPEEEYVPEDPEVRLARSNGWIGGFFCGVVFSFLALLIASWLV